MAYIQRINGTIWHDGWFGYQLESALNRHKEEDVHLVITSPGGEVGEAIRLSDLIKAHGRVTIEFSGLAASAATWLGFAANKVVMHNDTLWLCHRTSCSVFEWDEMNAEELANFIKEKQSQQKSLEVLDAIIAGKYLERCKGKGKNLKDVVDLMKEERYLSPSDCLAWGFVDEILETPANEDDVTSIVNAFKLPEVPRGYGVNVQEPGEGFSMSNIVEAVFQKMKDLFVPKGAEKSEGKEVKLVNQIEMNKIYSFVNALLKVEGVNQDADTKAISMTEEQVSVIENRLSEADKQQKELNEVVEALNAISPALKDIDGVKNKVAAVKGILDKVSSHVAPQPKVMETDENNLFEDGDPINAVAQQYINKGKNN